MTALNESIPFVAFVYDEHTALFQRQTPDAMGARQVIVPYSSISYIKITAIVLPKVFNEMGYEGTLPKM